MGGGCGSWSRVLELTAHTAAGPGGPLGGSCLHPRLQVPCGSPHLVSACWAWAWL